MSSLCTEKNTNSCSNQVQFSVILPGKTVEYKWSIKLLDFNDLRLFSLSTIPVDEERL